MHWTPIDGTTLLHLAIDFDEDEIFELLLEVASGRRTCAERLGHQEFVPWRIGPVL